MSLRPPRDVLSMAEYAVAGIRAKLYSWNYVTQPASVAAAHETGARVCPYKCGLPRHEGATLEPNSRTQALHRARWLRAQPGSSAWGCSVFSFFFV